MDIVGDNEESVSTESSQHASPAYREILEVMAHATKRLELVGGMRNRSVCGSRLGRGALHTMAVLQAQQADLLKDLDEGKGLSPEAMEELHHRSRSPCCQANRYCHRPGDGAMVAMERHLWLNLVDIGSKENNLFLDAPFSSSVLFGTSVEALVEKFRDARAQSADFKRYIPHRSRSSPKTFEGAGPSRSEDRRQDQKSSVATCAPPPSRSRAHRRRDTKESRGDLQKVIEKRRTDSRHSVSNSP